jgi:hypothetical protein
MSDVLITIEDAYRAGKSYAEISDRVFAEFDIRYDDEQISMIIAEWGAEWT